MSHQSSPSLQSTHLRDYQIEAHDAIETAFAHGIRRPILSIPTGTGKTVVFVELIRRRGGRALVLVHRDELVQQAKQRLHDYAPELQVGVVKAEQDEHDAQVVIASVQTLAHATRLARIVPRTSRPSWWTSVTTPWRRATSACCGMSARSRPMARSYSACRPRPIVL